MTVSRGARSRVEDFEGGGIFVMLIGGVLTFALTMAVGLAVLGIGLSERRVVPGGSGSGPGVSALTGERVFASTCATCHGAQGGGGIGPELAGVVGEKYPDIADQIAVVTDGRGGMPAFGDVLTGAEIESVVMFERTELGS